MVIQTRGLTPQTRVGFGVIAKRYSEYTNHLQSMISHSLTTSESWRRLPWKKFQKTLFRLQKRVYKSDVFGGSFPRKARAAVRAGDKQKARSLQKLILKSQSAKLLAIRQVTQLNAGKKTAGVDGKKSLSFEERFALATELNKNHTNWRHQRLREIPILKKDGTIRMLKVPTIADRAWQCLAKYALEPAHEATFHARSYGLHLTELRKSILALDTQTTWLLS